MNKTTLNSQKEKHSMLSLRRATFILQLLCIKQLNFYPRSPCGERRCGGKATAPTRYFYPRSPCGERRECGRPARCSLHFYPRSPCGERRRAQAAHYRDGQISIHALLAESEPRFRPGRRPYSHFYPRSPCGERRWSGRLAPLVKEISIHALLAESDAVRWAFEDWYIDFYPRSPCGERLGLPNVIKLILTFLSTLSLRRATRPFCMFIIAVIKISIHALLAESDNGKYPCRWAGVISIHALLAESDGGFNVNADVIGQFLSTLSLRRATRGPNASVAAWNPISIHALLAESDHYFCGSAL